MAKSMYEQRNRLSKLNDSNFNMIERLRTFCISQIEKVDSDIKDFTSYFNESSELARLYLNEQLSKDVQNLIERTYKNSQIIQTTLEDQNLYSQLPDLEADSMALESAISEAYINRKAYKFSQDADSLFEELKGHFHKFTKEMFRKFKKFLVTAETAGSHSTKEVKAAITDMRSHIEKIMQPAESVNWRLHPEKLPVLETFPYPQTNQYRIVSEKFGPFNPGDKLDHPAFRELNTLALKMYPPLKLEDGSVYEGEWENFMRTGRGKCVFKSGDFYEGYWRGDIPDILGRVVNTTGDVYEVLRG